MEDDNLINVVKGFQTLSSLVDNISGIQKVDGGFIIQIDNISLNDLVSCCGEETVEESQKRLLQGLQHDMEEKGLGDNMDLDLSVVGNENEGITLQIKVSTNNDGILGNDMKNKEMEEKKNTTNKEGELILGGEGINESKKRRVVRLTETQMASFIKRMISESEISQPFTEKVKGGMPDQRQLPVGGTPGVENARKSRNDSGKENKENLENVGKKMKEYLSFDGNDNPEFPKQIGKGEKVARENTSDQEQEIEDNRSRGPQDIVYDTDVATKQSERIKKAMTGDPEMGNEEDDSNMTKSDTGEKMVKNMEDRIENKKKEPLYNRASVPATTSKKPGEKNTQVEKPAKQVNEEIEKMKSLYRYNERTQ